MNYINTTLIRLTEKLKFNTEGNDMMWCGIASRKHIHVTSLQLVLQDKKFIYFKIVVHCKMFC